MSRFSDDQISEAYGIGAETYQECRAEGDSASEAALAADMAVARFLGCDVEEAQRLVRDVEDVVS